MANSGLDNLVSGGVGDGRVEPLRAEASERGVCLRAIGETSHAIDTFDALPGSQASGAPDQAFLIGSIDLLGAILLAAVTLPLWMVIFVLIKMTSPGPAIYRQQRVGKNGKVFTLYKFRTMVEHAEKEWGFLPAVEDDVRITKIGRVLRRTRLDELPQLINVLKGDMSLVGPRPENLHRVSMHKALQGARLAVRPGITGLAQVRSLYDLKPDHKLKYDYLYIQKRSVWLNLYILAKTIPVIFGKTGW